VLGHLAGAEGLRLGDRERGVEMARRAWGDGALLEHVSAEDPAVGSITGALSFAEEFGEALGVADALVADAQRRGSGLGFVSASYLRGSLFLLQGQLNEAIADLEIAVDGRRYGWEQYLPRALGQLAEALFEAGDAVRPQIVFAAAQREPDFGQGLMWGMFFDHRGTIALASGDNEGAVEFYGRARDAVTAVMGPRPNPVYSPWRRGTGIALARLGRGAEALALVDEEVELAREWGAGGTLGTALVARGTVLGRDGLDDMADGVALLRNADMMLPLARGELTYGSALRAAGRRTDAQDALRRALDVAERSGARRVAALAHEELVAAGARPRRARMTGVASLTPGELRVARMAAGGMTNREIAEALFVTRKAIQWHLGNAYRKLGIASREELPAALGEDAAPA
jgi:DNA-binding CsgD family transcriptional regulator